MSSDVTQFKRELIRLLPRLRRFAGTLTHDSADADDLVQSACERAIARMGQWQAGTRLDAWVYVIMRNLWISEIRKRRVRTGQGVIEAGLADLTSSAATAEDTAYVGQVGQMVRSLPEGLASVLLLVGVEDHSYAETAEILDIPVGTVMSRLSRARAHLRDAMNKGNRSAMRKA